MTVKFSDEPDEICLVERIDVEMKSTLFYQEKDIDDFRHLAFMIESGLEEEDWSVQDVEPIAWPGQPRRCSQQNSAPPPPPPRLTTIPLSSPTPRSKGSLQAGRKNSNRRKDRQKSTLNDSSSQRRSRPTRKVMRTDCQKSTLNDPSTQPPIKPTRKAMRTDRPMNRPVKGRSFARKSVAITASAGASAGICTRG